MVLCVDCNKKFGSKDALSQHLRDSPAHAFDCDDCDRRFRTEAALRQHLRDSPAHAPTFDCDDCDRSFRSEVALRQHLRDAPAHAPTFDCDDCDRRFRTEEALEQHLRDSPAHAETFDCDDCDRSFRSEEALQQHIRDSPAHAETFDCDDCDRSFRTEEALEQHMRDSPAHKQRFGCRKCDRSFRSEDALSQHVRDAPGHRPTFDCDECDRTFNSEDALEQHLLHSKAHSCNPTTSHSHRTSWSSRSCQTNTASTNTSNDSEGSEYNGVPSSLVVPVFKVAVKRRRSRPTVPEIVRATGTSIEPSIVAAIIEAAERLNSFDESTEDAKERAERARKRTEQAYKAEYVFAQNFAREGIEFLSELEQQEEAKRLKQRVYRTPDMKFASPVVICGQVCHWLEFKNYFAFPRNPFVARREKNQLRDYASAFGPGAVVYSLGFQSGYPSIEGVSVFRAREVLQCIAGTGSAS